MEPKSVSYHVGDGEWQELKWNKQQRLFVSDDGTIRVAKPKTEDGKETVRAQWGDSEYTVTCTPGYDPTLCSIYDPSKGHSGRVEIRFGSTPPALAAAKPEAAAAAHTPPPPAERAAPSAPPPPSSQPSGRPASDLLSDRDRGYKLAEWANSETIIPKVHAHKVAQNVHRKYGKKPVSEKVLKAYYDAAIEIERRKLAGSADKPVRPEPRVAPAPSRSTAPPSDRTAPALLSDKERRYKLAEWANAEKNIPTANAHNVAQAVYKRYGRRPIAERYLKAYYNAAIELEKRKLGTVGPQPRLDLGAPGNITLGAPGSSPAIPEKPSTMREFRRELGNAVKEAFPDRLGYNGKFRRVVEQKIIQKLGKHRRPHDKLENLPEMIKAVQDAIHKGTKIGDKIEARPFGLRPPVVRGKGDVLEQLLIEIISDPTERETAKRVILADLRTRFGRHRYRAKDVGAAITKYLIDTRDTGAESLPPPVAPKSKQELVANRKILGAANKAFDRIDAIKGMTPEDQNKITANEFTHLYDAIQAFRNMIVDREPEKSRADAAAETITKLVDQVATAHMNKLHDYAAAMKKAFSEINLRGFRTAKANFLARFERVKTYLRGVSKVAPQQSRLSEIEDLKASVITLNPASVRGDEKELRTKLNAIEAALRHKPDPIYPHTRTLIAVETKLDSVRAGLKAQVTEEFDSKIRRMREVVSEQQQPILEGINGYLPLKVAHFENAAEYEWLINSTDRVSNKQKAQKAIRHLAGLFGPTTATTAKDLTWDERLLFSRGGTIDNLKSLWENAQAALKLIHDYERTGRSPALIPPKPLSPQELANKRAKEAAEAAYRPVETKLTETIRSVGQIYSQFFDITKRWHPPIPFGPPYINEFPAVLTRLKGLENELNTSRVDNKIYDALDRDRKAEIDTLQDKIGEAYTHIRSTLNFINSIKPDDVRFIKPDQLIIEIENAKNKSQSASLPVLNLIRYRLNMIREVSIDRFAKGDRSTTALLSKINPIIAAVELRITELGGQIPEPSHTPTPTPATRSVVEAPARATAPAESDMNTPVTELSDEMFRLRMQFAAAEDKLPANERIRTRVSQILAVAEKRTDEDGMSRVAAKARAFLKAIDRKIAEIKGAAPAAPASRPTPPAEDEVSKLMSLEDARQQLTESKQNFKKFNQRLETLSFGELIKYRAGLDEILVDSAWNKKDLKGKSSEYKTHSELAQIFNKKVGTFNKRVAAEISLRLDKRMAAIVAIKNRAVAAVSDSDAAALSNAKVDMSKEMPIARQELAAVGKLVKEAYWNADDFTKRSASINKIDKDVKGLTIDKAKLNSKDTAAANKALDNLLTELDNIKTSLKKNPDLEQLNELERRIIDAIERVKPLESSPVGARAQGIHYRFTGILSEIAKIRLAHVETTKNNQAQQEVTTLLARGEKLKGTALDVTTLEANQKELEGIKTKLKAINNDITETDITRNLKNRIANGIIKIDSYIAGLGNAISVKRAVKDASDKAERDANRLKESVRTENLKVQSGAQKGQKDIAKTLAAIRLDQVVSGVVRSVAGKAINYENVRPDIGGYRIPVISVKQPSNNAGRAALASKLISGILKKVWDSGGDPSEFRILIVSHLDLSGYQASLSIPQKYVPQYQAFADALGKESFIRLHKIDPLVVDKTEETKVFTDVVSIFFVPKRVFSPAQQTYGGKVERRIGGVGEDASAESTASPEERIIGQYITRLGLKSGVVTELPTIGGAK